MLQEETECAEKCAKKKKCKDMNMPAVLWGNIQEGGEGK